MLKRKRRRRPWFLLIWHIRTMTKWYSRESAKVGKNSAKCKNLHLSTFLYKTTNTAPNKSPNTTNERSRSACHFEPLPITVTSLVTILEGKWRKKFACDHKYSEKVYFQIHSRANRIKLVLRNIWMIGNAQTKEKKMNFISNHLTHQHDDSRVF